MVNSVIKLTLAIYLVALVINLSWLIRSTLTVRRAQRKFFWSWMLFFFAVAVFFRKTQGGIVGDSQSLYQLGCVGIGVVLLLFAILGTRLQAGTARVAVVLLFLYGIFGMMTAVLSPMTMLSAYKAGLVVLDSLLLLAGVSLINTREDAWKLVAFTSFMVSLFAVGSLAGALVWPDYAFRPISGGVFGFILDGTFPIMNGNELGFIGGMTMVVAFRRFFGASGISIRFFWFAQGLVGLVALGLAQARTSLVTAALAVVVISYVLPRFRIVAIIGTLMVVVIGGYSLVTGSVPGNNNDFEVAQAYLQKGQDEGGLQTLKGRMDMWAGSGMAMFYKSPIFGNGFDAGTRVMLESHFHNSHIQILANSGALGYALWIPLILFVISKSLAGFINECVPIARTSEAREYAEVFAILWMILLRTFTGSVLVTHHWSLMILIASIIYFCAKKNHYIRVGSIVAKRKSIAPQKLRARTQQLKTNNGETGGHYL